MALATMTGCASTGAYFADRGRDAADIVTVAVGAGVGVKTRIGPLHAGLGFHSDMLGLRGGQVLCGSFADYGGDAESPFPAIPMRCVFMCSVEDFYRIDEGWQDDPITQRHKIYHAWNFSPFITTQFEPTRPRTISGTNEVDNGTYLFHPYWTQIDLMGDAIVGCRVGLNPGELIDFLFGWFGVDMFDDDLNTKRMKNASNQAFEVTARKLAEPQR